MPETNAGLANAEPVISRPLPMDGDVVLPSNVHWTKSTTGQAPGVGVRVAVGVAVGTGVDVGVFVGVCVGVSVAVGVGVGAA
jgi:hypothetical protein